jgi:hypothetical protein
LSAAEFFDDFVFFTGLGILMYFSGIFLSKERQAYSSSESENGTMIRFLFAFCCGAVFFTGDGGESLSSASEACTSFVFLAVLAAFDGGFDLPRLLFAVEAGLTLDMSNQSEKVD